MGIDIIKALGVKEALGATVFKTNAPVASVASIYPGVLS